MGEILYHQLTVTSPMADSDRLRLVRWVDHASHSDPSHRCDLSEGRHEIQVVALPQRELGRSDGLDQRVVLMQCTLRKMENIMLICLYRRPANAAYRVWGSPDCCQRHIAFSVFCGAFDFCSAHYKTAKECTLTTYYSNPEANQRRYVCTLCWRAGYLVRQKVRLSLRPSLSACHP